MASWRDLGLGKDRPGTEFTPVAVTCPFCGGRGNFNRVFRGEARDLADRTPLYSDVWQCQSCASFVYVIWRTEEGYVTYRVFPYEKQRAVRDPSWPENAGHAYVEAVTALLEEDFVTAATMARRAIGAATRWQEARGDGLAEEIEDLGGRGLVPEPLVTWARAMPQLSGGGSHEAQAHESKELIRFCRYLLDILFTLPAGAEEFRGRGAL